MTINDLYKQKQQLFYEATQIKETAKKEERQLNEEELANFKKYFDDIEKLDEQIKAEERYSQFESTLNDPFYNPNGKKSGKKTGDVKIEVDEALNRWLKYGTKKLTDEERSILNVDETGLNLQLGYDKRDGGLFKDVEKRTSAVANPTYVAPITLADMFNTTKKAIGPWMEACTQIYTPTGETMYMPYTNDAGNDGAQEAEGTDAIASSTDVSLARTQLDSYWISSTGLYVGWSTLRDANFPAETFIIDPLMKRLMRKISDLATDGGGSSAPNGICDAAVVGEVATASTTPDNDDLVGLLKLVDYAYHTGPKSGWMFNSNTMFRIAGTVKSSTYNTEPLWQPSLAAGVPSTLHGYKYWINNSMDSVGANKKIMLFGDFSAFVLRWAGPLIISRLEERYAEKGQVGFLVSQYFDSEISYTGTTYAPIKYLRNLGT